MLLLSVFQNAFSVCILNKKLKLNQKLPVVAICMTPKAIAVIHRTMRRIIHLVWILLLAISIKELKICKAYRAPEIMARPLPIKLAGPIQTEISTNSVGVRRVLGTSIACNSSEKSASTGRSSNTSLKVSSFNSLADEETVSIVGQGQHWECH